MIFCVLAGQRFGDHNVKQQLTRVSCGGGLTCLRYGTDQLIITDILVCIYLLSCQFIRNTYSKIRRIQQPGNKNSFLKVIIFNSQRHFLIVILAATVVILFNYYLMRTLNTRNTGYNAIQFNSTANKSHQNIRKVESTPQKHKKPLKIKTLMKVEFYSKSVTRVV